MAEPKGEIIARPKIARACGCLQEFQHYAVDKYRAQRQAKFQKTRCAACVAKLVQAERLAAEAIPTKAEALGALPPGTQIILNRGPDGAWSGMLTVEGKSFKAAGAGPRGITIALARAFLGSAKDKK